MGTIHAERTIARSAALGAAQGILDAAGVTAEETFQITVTGREVVVTAFLKDADGNKIAGPSGAGCLTREIRFRVTD